MKTLLRIIPLLAVICVAVFVFPNQASALDVRIAGRTIDGGHNTPANDPNATILLSGDTLTLENAYIELNDSTHAIEVTGDPTEKLNIVLIGNNRIEVEGWYKEDVFEEGHLGFLSEVDLIFSGSGSLTITSKLGTGIEGRDFETKKPVDINVIVNGGSLSVSGNTEDPTGKGTGTSGIFGNLFVGAGAKSVYVKGSENSVSGTITEFGTPLEIKPNPYSYPKIEDQQQQQQEQQPVNRENVVFPMNSSLSNPSSLTFTFDGGYFANFEGVWIHGYAVPKSAYTTRVIDGVLYIYLNEDYLFYVLGLARGEEHLMHAVFSNGYGITKFTY